MEGDDEQNKRARTNEDLLPKDENKVISRILVTQLLKIA